MCPAFESRSRQDSSFERLYRRHRRDVYGAVLRDVRDPDEAEDVTQTAFLNAFRAMRRGERPDKPRAWLVTIARNVIRRRYREFARRPQEVALDPEIAADLADVDGPTAGEIAAAIRRLPASQQAVILLREIQGRSYADIAAELGLSLAAVETLIFRARRNLSEVLEVADHVPATQSRRTRALALLSLPGLGKLGSQGFSVARVGAAAVAGGAAIIAMPVSDRGPAPAPVREPVVQQAPVLEEAGHPGRPPASVSQAVRAAAKPSAEPAKKRPEDGLAGASTETPSAPTVSGVVPGVVPGVETPEADLPSADDVTDDVPLPPLTVESPDLVSPLPVPTAPDLPPPPDLLPPPELPLPLG